MNCLCLFWHSWVPTHVNRWQIETRQECERCGKARVWVGGVAGSWHDEDDTKVGGTD